MTRARELAKLANSSIFSVDSGNNVGINSLTPDAKLDVVGVVSATQYFGDGSNLTGIVAGATLNASSGTQRLVVTSQTSGSMTQAATNADITYATSTNTLSATTFSGAFSGNVTGNVSGTAGGLTGTPNIIVGSVTGTTGSFSGSVSVGGTITYEDVANVDSVGLITARTGVRVNAGGLVVTAGISTLGAGVSVTGPYKENITAMGALEVDCSQGNYFTKTIAGNSTFTFANVPTGCAYAFTLELTHSSGTVSWPASVKFPADTAPTLTAGKTHLFMFITDDGGTRFRGSSLVDYVN